MESIHKSKQRRLGETLSDQLRLSELRTRLAERKLLEEERLAMDLGQKSQ
uniref:Uncharacterized protein n=1 Tax=Salix viminalis TaxID=40686 RepID=A0A6N2LZ61_SALVM